MPPENQGWLRQRLKNLPVLCASRAADESGYSPEVGRVAKRESAHGPPLECDAVDFSRREDLFVK